MYHQKPPSCQSNPSKIKPEEKKSNMEILDLNGICTEEKHPGMNQVATTSQISIWNRSCCDFICKCKCLSFQVAKDTVGLVCRLFLEGSSVVGAGAAGGTSNAHDLENPPPTLWGEGGAGRDPPDQPRPAKLSTDKYFVVQGMAILLSVINIATMDGSSLGSNGRILRSIAGFLNIVGFLSGALIVENGGKPALVWILKMTAGFAFLGTSCLPFPDDWIWWATGGSWLMLTAIFLLPLRYSFRCNPQHLQPRVLTTATN